MKANVGQEISLPIKEKDFRQKKGSNHFVLLEFTSTKARKKKKRTEKRQRRKESLSFWKQAVVFVSKINEQMSKELTYIVLISYHGEEDLLKIFHFNNFLTFFVKFSRFYAWKKIFVQGKFHRENSFHKNNLESRLFTWIKQTGHVTQRMQNLSPHVLDTSTAND